MSKRVTSPTIDPLSAYIATAVRNELRIFLPELIEELAKRQPSSIAPPSSEQTRGKLRSTKDVAAAIGVSKPTLWRMIRRGEFPKPLQVSPGRVGFRPEDVDRWLEGKRR